MRKITIISVVLATLVLVGLSIFARKAPETVIALLERRLKKDIIIGDFRYKFPLGFEIDHFNMNETALFSGENSLFVKSLRFRVDPFDLLKRRVNFEVIDIESPQITIRKHKGRIYYPLSAPEARGSPAAPPDAPSPRITETGAVEKDPIVIEIKRLWVSDGVLRFVDYDIGETGFAIVATHVNARIRNISTEHLDEPIQFNFDAKVQQGRQQEKAQVAASGWYSPSNRDMENNVKIVNLWLPHYRPYSDKVTSSQITDGLVEAQSTTVVRDRDWTTNAQVTLRRLQFGKLESGEQILGYDAGSILGILRDRHGQIALDLVVRWNMNDPEMNFHKALRSSIRFSVKNTFLMNLHQVVENTLNKISEDGADFISDLKKRLNTDEARDWKDNISGIVGDLLDSVE